MNLYTLEHESGRYEEYDRHLDAILTSEEEAVAKIDSVTRVRKWRPKEGGGYEEDEEWSSRHRLDAPPVEPVARMTRRPVEVVELIQGRTHTDEQGNFTVEVIPVYAPLEGIPCPAVTEEDEAAWDEDRP